MNLREQLPLVEAPEAIWQSIEAALREGRSIERKAAPRWRVVWTVAAMFCAAAGVWWFTARHTAWIETSASAGTTLRIGNIGSVDVGPNTRLKIVADRTNEHRLTLARGSIYAKISAPPRLFFVETKSGTATDLGCEYKLDMDDDGSGMLRVTKGWVSFDREGHESLVPAGARARIRAGKGADLPYFDDASPSFRQAVDAGDIDAMLRTARVADTLTLWNLLPRATPAERARIYERISALVPLPEGITKEKIQALDRVALDRLKEKLAWNW